MAVAVEVLTLVLEFDIDWGVPPTGELCMLNHLRDVSALRCTNRRRHGDIEIRVDLFLARGLRGHFYATRRFAHNQGRFYMAFLRAIVTDFVDMPVMRPPALVEEFRESPRTAREQAELARERIFSAQVRGHIVDVDNDADLPRGNDSETSEEEFDAGSDMSLASDGAVTSSTEIPWGGYESESPPVSTEISIENHADIADLADLADLED